MESKINDDINRVLDEVLISREYVNQVHSSIHQQIWEVRRIAEETRSRVGVLMGLVILLLVILCWKFIAAIFVWFAGCLLLLYKFLQPEIDSITGWDIASFIFWALMIYFAAFISFHLIKNLISLLIRLSSEKIKDESTKAESGQSGTNQTAYSDGTDRAAYAERMSDYLREAQSYLDKQKEAKFGGK